MSAERAVGRSRESITFTREEAEALVRAVENGITAYVNSHGLRRAIQNIKDVLQFDKTQEVQTNG
jgi:hypothetical protein